MLSLTPPLSPNHYSRTIAPISRPRDICIRTCTKASQERRRHRSPAHYSPRIQDLPNAAPRDEFLYGAICFRQALPPRTTVRAEPGGVLCAGEEGTNAGTPARPWAIGERCCACVRDRKERIMYTTRAGVPPGVFIGCRMSNG